MNKHPKEVTDFMKSCAVGGRPTEAKQLAKFKNRYGEEKIIHITRSGLRVKRNESTVVLTLNAKVAELMSARIKARRKKLGLTLEELCTRAGIATTTPKSRMWEIENGVAKGGLRFGTLYALAIALECKPGDLMPSVDEVLGGANVQSVSETTLKLIPE